MLRLLFWESTIRCTPDPGCYLMDNETGLGSEKQ
jgi:hypothetical protein